MASEKVRALVELLEANQYSVKSDCGCCYECRYCSADEYKAHKESCKLGQALAAFNSTTEEPWPPSNEFVKHYDCCEECGPEGDIGGPRTYALCQEGKTIAVDILYPACPPDIAPKAPAPAEEPRGYPKPKIYDGGN